MEIQHMVEYGPEGAFLKLGKSGRKLPLMRGQRTRLPDVAGACEVEIACDDDNVSVRAKIPESSGPLTCVVGLRSEGFVGHGSLGRVSARTLEDWILDSRVQANGHL